jgi:hypothetical protein
VKRFAASIVVLCAAASISSAAAAAAAVTLPADAVRACRAERDDQRRLACFDAASARLDAAEAAASAGDAATRPGDQAIVASGAASAGGAAVSLAAMTPEQRFGYRGDMARESGDRDATAQDLGQLTSRVKIAGRQASGDFVVTLDNGQSWAQLPLGTPHRLSVGDEVTISRGALGSFLLEAPDGRGIRVKRVR